MEGDLITLIFFAGVAIVIIIKFNSILGKRFEDDDKVVDLSQYREREPVKDPEQEALEKERAMQHEREQAEVLEKLDVTTLQNVKELMKKDPSFSVDTFLQGGRAAFEMIIEAFSNADKTTLRNMLDDNVYYAFEKEIENLKSKGRRKEITIISIVSADIVKSVIVDNHARISLRFVSEQIDAVYDMEGNIIEGNKTEINTLEDVWTFKKPIKSSNPNWLLCETN
ncbi:MAG: Tim44/TimA family putative adaptor protein [Rickettsiales bacterium]|nr:Tim44/TimA family putative adaptor protein [Rickettsiales bacterium]